MTSADESSLRHAREILAERYPGEQLEIICMFDIAHVGWECDSRGALITRDGKPELVIIDETGGVERPVREILEAKVVEYEQLAAETRNALEQLMVLEGLPRVDTDLDDVDFDLDRDSAYHVAREFMRNRIAALSAQVERLENKIVDIGVEMSALDYRDRDAIENAIDKYRNHPITRSS